MGRRKQQPASVHRNAIADAAPVSYTHLDVYKRQDFRGCGI